MIQITARARRLAGDLPKPAALRFTVYKAPSPSSLTISRSLCVPPQRLKPRKTNTFLQPFSVQQGVSLRYCSHQRAMCRKNADIPGGSMDITKNREVLPTNVNPLHYDLILEPDFEKFTYEGTVVIEYVR